MANFVWEAWREMTIQTWTNLGYTLLTCCASGGMDSEKKHDRDFLDTHDVSLVIPPLA